MRILVSNDDGIFSPGIRVLANAAKEFGDVRVVAPDVEQSAMSHAITIRRPLHYHPVPLDDLEAYRVDGTPADCVALGAYHWDEVDMVLTGINLGLNIGHNIWHSGTVAAAKQAAFLGIPAIAFSAPFSIGPEDYAPLMPYLSQVIRDFMKAPDIRLLNVNFPEQPRGITWARQSVRNYEGIVVPDTDPMGREHFWFSERAKGSPEEGTDRWGIENQLVTLTPLTLDLTDRSVLEAAAEKVPHD